MNPSHHRREPRALLHPSDKANASGCPSRSQTQWILGGQAAPRLPPGARSTGASDPPWTASRRGSIRPSRGRTTHPSRPIHQTILAKPSMSSRQEGVERAFLPPGPKAIRYRLPRAQSFRPITPVGARAQNSGKTLEHGAISTPGGPIRWGVVTISLTRSHGALERSYCPTLSPPVSIDRPTTLATSPFRPNLVQGGSGVSDSLGSFSPRIHPASTRTSPSGGGSSRVLASRS
jgi:hypothetical protein